MKKFHCLSIVPALLLVSCMDTTALDSQQAAAAAAISAEGQAATNLYLGDMNAANEAEAREPANGERQSGFPGMANKGRRPAIDPSVQDDTREERLAAMAKTVLDRLDTDDNGTISKAEFLALAKPMDSMNGMPKEGEIFESVQKKMEAQFDAFANGDELSVVELEALLKALSEQIGQFRSRNFPGQHLGRLAKCKEEVLAKYDTNKDGKLDDAEIAALRAAEKDAWKERAERDDARGISVTPEAPALPADQTEPDPENAPLKS